MSLIYQLLSILLVMDKKLKKVLTTIMPILVLSVLAGLGTITALSGDYNNSSSYKQATCLSKVIKFAQNGIIRDIGGFTGALSECSQIQWHGSIYE
jgi:hypothetical protein